MTLLVDSTRMVRMLLSDWSASDEQQSLEAEPDSSLLVRLAHSLSVEIRLADLLEEGGFGRHSRLVTDVAICSESRQRAVHAFASEQAVMTDLDRRDSNPSMLQMMGVFPNPADEARYQRILAEVRISEPEGI